MEIKGSENQFQTASLREIGGYDVNKEEHSIVLDDVCKTEALELYGSGMDDSLSLIPAGMVVDGDINSSQAISLKGRINGNVITDDSVDVAGLVVGDITADSVHFDSARVHGNSTANSDIVVEDGAVIVGDLTAEHINVNGRVKGFITASKYAVFKNQAIVIGDVKTGLINVDENAKVNANITLVTNNVDKIRDDEFSFETGV